MDEIRDAVLRVVEKNEILHTDFVEMTGAVFPVQVIKIEPSPGEALGGVGVLRVNSVNNENSVAPHELLHQTVMSASDLTCEIAVKRCEPSSELLIVKLSALLADRIGARNLACAICIELSGGQSTVPIQYADYAQWQNELTEPSSPDPAIDDLEKTLNVIRPDIPRCDWNLSASADSIGWYRLELGTAIASSLNGFEKEHSLSIADATLTAWSSLLFRTNVRSSLIIGLHCDGRKYPELVSAIGIFEKFVPICIPIEEEMPFVALARKVSRASEAARSEQDYFTWDAMIGQDETDPSPRSFEWCYEYVTREVPEKVVDVACNIEDEYSWTESCKVKLSIEEIEGIVSATFYYQESSYSLSDIELMADQFKSILESIIAHPSAAICDLEMSSASEREQVLVGWNRTTIEYPRRRCVHEVFEERAKEFPDRAAVMCGESKIGFAELNRRANRIARLLQRRGIGAGAVVGVCLERSVEMVTALLGTLKAGAAYVPLDPEYPRDRLAFMLSDSNAAAVLTHSRLASVLPHPSVLNLDEIEAELVKLEMDNLPAVASPDDLAYILYTSGSTGQPKGVTIPHRALMNHMQWMHETVPLLPSDRVLQKTPFSFDASVWEFYAPLLEGACLVMAESGGHRDPDYLVRAICRYEITRLQLVPSLLAQLLDHPGFPECRILQKVFCGGEVLTPQMVEKFFGLSSAELYNLYGPTEATIDASFWKCVPGEHRASIPIGNPIFNTKLYVLDSRLRPVPVGVGGELYIGGDGLARGYQGRPDLTAERFLPDPFGHRGGSRLYRTGDRARWLTEGAVEYLGRNDDQVKVRGFRIELAEIEAALKVCPQVRDAAVLVDNEERSTPQLIAYLVAGSDMSGPAAVREHLQQSLPEYMVPQGFILLPELPRLPNGKLDRQALRAMASAAIRPTGRYQPPRNEMERLLTEIWQEVLGVEQVGIHDNFFELGGHSLLATQVVSRMRFALKVELPLRAIFENPTIQSAVTVLRELLAEGSSPPYVGPEPKSIQGPVPLSFAQERLWFLHQMAPASPFYNMTAAVKVGGELRADLFEGALDLLVKRHEALRTTFNVIDGKPRQVISAEPAVPLTYMDVQDLAKEDLWDFALKDAQSRTLQAFDLSKGPLMRILLYRIDTLEYLLVISVHHIVSDGWSLNLFLRELASLYVSQLNDRPSALPELAIQYSDFAAWHRDWVTSEVLPRQLGYWMNRLKDMPESTDLPFDHPRPAVQSFQGKTLQSDFSNRLSQDVRIFCRQMNATPYMVLLAVFNALLYRYSGQEDIVVGTPIANRNWASSEALMGVLTNTLLIRTDLKGNPTFNELLARVREDTLNAYAFQDVPFEKIVDEIKPTRDVSRQALFQVMFAFQNVPAAAIRISNLMFSPIDLERHTVQFDWNVSFEEVEGNITGRWQYSTDLFESATITRLITHYEQLLKSCITNPDRAICDLEMSSASEREQVLVGWNRTTIEYPRRRCVHEVFEERAKEFPDRAAVMCGESKIGFAELNRRANRIARLLQRRGIGAGAVVGVCLERSVEMVTALLGTLKAGAAYVPLDPEYPRDRLAFMLSDSNAAAVLTHSRLASVLPHPSVLNLDEIEAELVKLEMDNLPAVASPDDLAYILYTSGSTGQPKGVTIPHRALMNHMQWMHETVPLLPSDRVLQKTPFSFDASVWEFYAPLLEGACLVMAESGGHRDPDYLVRAICRYEITRLQLVPSLLAQLLDHPGFPECRILQKVFCGGEVLTPQMVEKFFGLSSAELYNLYGPTEATIDASFWKCVPGEHRASIPIGNPIFNTKLYVLDSRLRPVPVGVGGELYIGGDGLARGYQGRPDLTAERFLPDPFGHRGGSRLYRTGDRARWLTEGAVEYLGRNDDQVKVRGFRIELAEIEAALKVCPQVRDAAVLVDNEERSTPQLIAYLVAGSDMSGPAAVREHLQQSLPEYMVPQGFILLPELPRLPNGKLDRQALRAMASAAIRPTGRYQPPRNEMERLLTEIWQEVLGVEQVGIHDNFFELGGDSILSIQVVSLALQEELKLGVRDMFEQQTIARLAAMMIVPPHTPLDQQVGRQRSVFDLTPIGVRFFEQELERPDHFNQSVLLQGAMDAAVLEVAVAKLVEHHDALRLRFERGPEGWRQSYAAAEEHRVVGHVDLSGLPEAGRRAELERLAEAAQSSLNLHEGPLLRVMQFDLGEQEQRLLAVVHHLAVDGVSWRILLEDLERLCEQASRGGPLEPGTGTASFRSWSEALSEYANSEEIKAEASFWISQQQAPVAPLAGRPSAEAGTVGQMRTAAVELTAEQTQLLLQGGPRKYRCQAQDLLLTALLLALRDWTGERRLQLDMEGHGREEVPGDLDVSRTVGWFTTVYPVVFELPPEEDLLAAVKSVRQQLRAVPRHGIGYGMLRYLSRDEQTRRTLAAAPGSPISFNYLGQFDQALGQSMRLAKESTGHGQHPANRSHYLLDVNALVVNRCFHLTFLYDEEHIPSERIEALQDGFFRRLFSLLHATPLAPALVPADFPLARLTQRELDTLLVRYPSLEDIYPLSPVQQGLLFHTLLSPDSGFYVSQAVLRMPHVSGDRLERTIEYLVQRHEMLRTIFVYEELDSPHQIVLRDSGPQLLRLRWQHIQEDDAMVAIKDYLDADRRRPFLMDMSTPARIAMVELAADNFLIAWTNHHILLDGWSFSQLGDELEKTYSAQMLGHMPNLLEPSPYRDYIEWLQGIDQGRAREFWEKELESLPAPLHLMIDRASQRTTVDVRDFGTEFFLINKDLSRAINEYARTHQLTPSTLFHGTWGAILNLYSGQSDLVIGITISGRPPELPSIHRSMGAFINVVPLRMHFSQNRRILDWFNDLQMKSANAQNFGYFPLSTLRALAGLKKEHTLVENLVTYQNFPTFDTIGNTAVTSSPIEIHEHSHYPLALRIIPNEAFTLRVSYDSVRFTPDSIQRLLEHFRDLLNSIANGSIETLSQISHVTRNAGGGVSQLVEGQLS